MANTLRFKRGLLAGLPSAAVGEPLFTTDTFDLYIGNGTGNTRFQKYIASGTTSQLLRGDGSLLTMPIVLTSPSNGEVLKYNGTNWVNSSDAGITGSGVAGQVAYFTGATTQGGSNNLFWDASNNRLGINNATPAQAFDLVGNALIKGSGSTSATTALLVENSAGTDMALFRNNRSLSFISDAGQLNIFSSADAANGLLEFDANSSASQTLFVQLTRGTVGLGTTGNQTAVRINGGFSPTSGTATWHNLHINPVINQTGGANGITRAIYIQPGLTSAADWRSIEWNNSTGWGLYGAGTAANYINGSLSIGTTTQSGKLYVTLPGINTTFDSGTATDARIEFRRAGTRIGLLNWDSGVVTLQADSGNYLGFNAGGTERARIFAGGNFAIGSTSDNGLRFQVTGDGSFSGFITANSYIYAGNGSTQTEMRINSSGGANEGPLLRFMKASANVAYIGTYSSIVSGTSNDLTFYSTSSQQWMTNNSGTTKMLLDASGNLGLGVTPSAWGATWRALELQYSSGGQAIAAYYPAIIANAYNTGGGFFYKQTSQASYYQQIIGQHRWFNAPSGTAGTAVTFTQAMTLDASGNLLVGTTTALYSAAGRGVVNINGTSTAILSLNINSNTNTGGYLYYDGTTINLLNSTSGGSLLFSTANTERARIDASGNLGLGTTSPTGGRLQVVSTLSRTIYAQNQLSTGNVQGIVSESVTTNTGYNAAFLANAANGAGGNFSFYGIAGNIYNAGNTLLGTLVDAGFRLDVNGTMRVSGASTIVGSGTTSATTALTVTNSAGSNNELLKVRNDGAIIIGYGPSTASPLIYSHSRTTPGTITNLGVGLSFSAPLGNQEGTRFWFGSQFTQASSSGTNRQIFSEYSISDATGGNATYANLLLGGSISQTGGSNGITRGLYVNYTLSAAADFRAVETSNNTGWAFYAAGTAPSLFGGAATFSSTISSTGTNGFAIGNLSNTQRIQYGSDVATSFSFLTAANAYAGLYALNLRATDAIAIGTTPDTNLPFKILKNINSTVGIRFENTSTGASAYSAVQFGTDVTGGTAFTNMVYGSSGITESGVYKPNGTSIINTGSGGLNFLAVSQPIRFFTSTGNGTLRAAITNDGDFTQYNGTNPSASTTDAFRMYSADITAGNAAPHFRTENGAVIKLYQETTGVTSATYIGGAGTGLTDSDTFDGYTIAQIVKALRNAGLLA